LPSFQILNIGISFFTYILNIRKKSHTSKFWVLNFSFLNCSSKDQKIHKFFKSLGLVAAMKIKSSSDMTSIASLILNLDVIFKVILLQVLHVTASFALLTSTTDTIWISLVHPFCPFLRGFDISHNTVFTHRP
jgi:hypothetical protein